MDISSYYESEVADAKPLPLVPTSTRTARQQGQSEATETTQRPIEQVERSLGPHLEAIRAYMERLETENQLLKDQVAYYRQKEETYRAASERLRNDLDAIDLNYVKRGQF
jgi:hypothetical protein